MYQKCIIKIEKYSNLLVLVKTTFWNIVCVILRFQVHIKVYHAHSIGVFVKQMLQHNIIFLIKKLVDMIYPK